MTRTLSVDPRKPAFVYTDGASRGNPGRSAIARVLVQGGIEIEAGHQTIGRATNNQAEYKAFVWGLQLAIERGLTDVTMRTDSELIVGHLVRGWKVNENREVHDEARRLLERMKAAGVTVRVAHVPRGENRRADELCNEALDGAA